MRRTVIAFAVLLACAGCAPRAPVPTTPEAGTAIVDVVVRSGADGRVRIAIFDSPASWSSGEPTFKSRVDAVDGEARWTGVELPTGRWAVKAYLDVDGNGTLDKGTFGQPTEPYGFSSGARGTFGPPSFDAAAVELRSGDRLAIEIELD